MEIVRQIYPLEMTSTHYTRLYSANSVYSTRRSRQENDFISPLGKRTDAEFASALHVEPFNTATKLYTHTRSTKKHTHYSPCDRTKAPCTPAMRVVWCLPQRSSTKKNRTLASSIPANTTLGCKLNTCSDRRGSYFSGAPAFYEVKFVQSCSKMRHDECGMIALTTWV